MPAPRTSKGLSPKVFHGLNKKRIQRRSGGGGKRLAFKNDDPTQTIQFLQTPEQFLEYDVHAFQEDGRWHFVPCAGQDDCPLCESEDDQMRRTSYRFACNVLNIRSSEVKILEGPQALAERVFYRFERSPEKFRKRVYDVTRFPTSPVTFNLEMAEEKVVPTRGLVQHDLNGYVLDEMKNYYGPDLTLVGGTLADTDDDDTDDEDDEDEPKAKAAPKKRRAAAPVVEDDDDDDEDDDDLDDDDLDDDELDDDTDGDDDADGDDEDDDDADDDEDDEPAPPPRARKAPAAKKSTPTKAAAKPKARAAR